jgi:hypothetical protein
MLTLRPRQSGHFAETGKPPVVPQPLGRRVARMHRAVRIQDQHGIRVVVEQRHRNMTGGARVFLRGQLVHFQTPLFGQVDEVHSIRPQTTESAQLAVRSF